MKTKKTSGTPNFAISLRQLTQAYTTSEAQAKSHLEAASKARTARFELITKHLEAGGTLSDKQLAMLPEMERSFANVAMLAKDANLPKAATEIAKTITETGKRVSSAFEAFFKRSS